MNDETATITKGRGFIRIHASEELLAGLGHPEIPELTIGDFHKKWHKALLLPDSYEIERVEQIKGHHGERDVFHIFVQHKAIPVIGDYEPMPEVIPYYGVNQPEAGSRSPFLMRIEINQWKDGKWEQVAITNQEPA